MKCSSGFAGPGARGYSTGPEHAHAHAFPERSTSPSSPAPPRARAAETGPMMRPAVAVALFGCLLLTLAATSTPRVVGDGSEYVHLAARLASGHLPGPGESRHFIF